jgi:hypothetical protein
MLDVLRVSASTVIRIVDPSLAGRHEITLRGDPLPDAVTSSMRQRTQCDSDATAHYYFIVRWT